jgi:hypothetical protein
MRATLREHNRLDLELYDHARGLARAKNQAICGETKDQAVLDLCRGDGKAPPKSLPLGSLKNKYLTSF